MNARQRADKLFAWLDRDILGRQGLGDEWGQIDDDIKEGIRKEWVQRFEQQFYAAAREDATQEPEKKVKKP